MVGLGYILDIVTQQLVDSPWPVTQNNNKLYICQDFVIDLYIHVYMLWKWKSWMNWQANGTIWKDTKHHTNALFFSLQLINEPRQNKKIYNYIQCMRILFTVTFLSFSIEHLTIMKSLSVKFCHFFLIADWVLNITYSIYIFKWLTIKERSYSCP